MAEDPRVSALERRVGALETQLRSEQAQRLRALEALAFDIVEIYARLDELAARETEKQDG